MKPMRVFFLSALLLLTGFAPNSEARRHGGAPWGKVYSTSFPATENPISQGGIWTNGSVFSQGAATKTNVQTAGKAYGTMVSFDSTNFIDSIAVLSGFHADQQVLVTISNSGGFSGFSLEVEILLHSDITSAHVFQYEVDCVYGGQGIDLVRWDMTAASPNSFTKLRNLVSNETPFANGDQVLAFIKGTVITVQYKLVASSTFSTVFTYDTSGDSIKYTTGNPGIGFWNQTGLTADQPLFALSNFTASEL